ncbi:ribosomal oxygenase 2 isoform X2 [Echeneis naucrates]|uniref:Bifunctional lysine-specific demethylase and histidyl-hydroxylase n=1 Tax=Echeneis naucrates TaxID=173247 RepID=A0A665TP26_ECHNA|nr:ribosomal oxygenase 2 isoform X2 [Echeneis naucrates]
MPKKSRTRTVKRRSGDATQPSPKKTNRAEAPLSFHSPSHLFESLIQPMGVEQFFREYWEKKPLHLQRFDCSMASYYQSLFQLSDLPNLCSQALRFYRDINIVCCSNGQKKVLNKEGKVKSSVLNKYLVQNKATIQVHQPQRFKDELWRIQEKLECFFGALVGSNVYITPQESQGLPVHYDDVEVFILQLEGQKQWHLYSPTVPLAAEYSVEAVDRLGSPTHDLLLKAGDLLYFPRGTIHQASTPAGVNHSTHLTLSTYQRMSWGDLLLDAFPGFLYDRSRTDISLREGIPRRLLLGDSDGFNTSRWLATMLRCLAHEVEAGKLEVHSTHLKRDFIMNRLPPYSLQPLAPSKRIPSLEDTVYLRFKDHTVVTVERSQERTDEATKQAVFVLHSLKNQRVNHMMGEVGDEESDIPTGLKFPLSHLQALRQLQKEDQLRVDQLKLPTQEVKLNLVLALWSESLLEVV